MYDDMEKIDGKNGCGFVALHGDGESSGSEPHKSPLKALKILQQYGKSGMSCHVRLFLFTKYQSMSCSNHIVSRPIKSQYHVTSISPKLMT